MRNITLPLPMIGFAIATRAMLAAGLALLAADKMGPSKRREIGTTLFAIGAATTIPLAMFALRKRRGARMLPAAVESDSHLIGATRFARKGDDPF